MCSLQQGDIGSMVFLLEAPKGLTNLATVTKAMSEVGVIGGGGRGSGEVRR